MRKSGRGRRWGARGSGVLLLGISLHPCMLLLRLPQIHVVLLRRFFGSLSPVSLFQFYCGSPFLKEGVARVQAMDSVPKIMDNGGDTSQGENLLFFQGLNYLCFLVI
ncbi:hypothetical protein TNIN_227901 [Trichonephila inaurata madagascariensis]|uniref:Uncharacterized protein n=1 Tax=Trichonephila inaurata madagascariensis TaxID=2747483 RepID=A0A8X6YX42_9ARAC|nr:hypothetical protein TNIN_227901 [Trichonephila inaurata madagascariensis]